MNALLINPWITDFKLYDEWMHPIGLYLLGSLLIENGWNIEYVNCLKRDEQIKPKRYNTGSFSSKIITKPIELDSVDRHYRQYGIDKERFINKLQEVTKPDIILITSGMTYWIDGLRNTISAVREIFPETQIVVGGISANLIPEILKKDLPKTTIFSGQLSDLKKLPVIEKSLNLDFDNLSLVPFFKNIRDLKHGPVLTTLGCPYNCSYCASGILQKQFTVRPKETIIEEIEYLINKRGIRNFSFYDDALLFKPQNNFLPLGEDIIKLNQNINFHAPNGLHIKWIDKEVLKIMKKMGFKTLRFGYESGNSRYKDYTGFKTEREEIKEKVNLILGSGFPAKDIGIYVMGGLPDQTPNQMYDDINFISSLGVKAKPVFISPVPGTSIYNYYSEIYPEIKSDPRLQNDIFFITKLKGWDQDNLEKIRKDILTLNRATEII